MRTVDELRTILHSHKRELEQRYKVESIALFGSYVRGEQNEGSDLDVLVEFSSPVSLLHIVSLENHLNDILGVQVDVIPRKNIREELRSAILREAVPL